MATAEHHRSRLKHDATSVWLEDVSASSFKICLRELQNFAGVHDDISVVSGGRFDIVQLCGAGNVLLLKLEHNDTVKVRAKDT